MMEKILVKLYDLKDMLSTKRIVVFGENKVMKICLELLQLEIEYFVDNESGKWGKLFYGKKIYNPEKLKNEKKEDLVILVASMHLNEISYNLSGEISCQLVEMGFVKGKEFFTFSDYDRSSDIERTIKVVNGVKVGKYTYGHEKICRKEWVESIGSFCSISNATIISPNHPLEYISAHPFLYFSEDKLFGVERVPGLLNKDIVKNANHKLYEDNGKIVIKNDVWIGNKANILSGVTINNGAIIGTGAVVTKDVPSYAVVGGVPARILKYRFNKEHIRRLNEIKWWDWSDEKIIESAEYFYDPQMFIDKFT